MGKQEKQEKREKQENHQPQEQPAFDGERQWAEKMESFHLPRWEDLPELELYMDQVVAFLEKVFAPLSQGEGEAITPAMINNYVKLRLIPKPEKKRYTRRHMACLVTITLLKQVLTISEIREGILVHTRQEGSGPKAYDDFCRELERSFRTVCGRILPETSRGPLCGEAGCEAGGEAWHEAWCKEDEEMAMVRMATLSLACKLAARKSLQIRKALQEEAIQQEQKQKQEQEEAEEKNQKNSREEQTSSGGNGEEQHE